MWKPHTFFFGKYRDIKGNFERKFFELSNKMMTMKKKKRIDGAGYVENLIET